MVKFYYAAHGNNTACEARLQDPRFSYFFFLKKKKGQKDNST